MKLIKQIKSKKGDIHFERYVIFTSRYFNIFIHKIYKADEDKYLHNHPWNIFTMILKGSYIELLESGENIRNLFNCGYRNHKQYHKILKLNSDKVVTLALTFGKRCNWFYLIDGKEVSNDTYRKEKH